MRSLNLRFSPNVSRSMSHMRKVSATTTPMTRTSFEIESPPSLGAAGVDETPTMKSRMPCQVA